MQETIELMPQQKQNNNHTVELLRTIIEYCVHVKMDHIIKIMIEHHQTSNQALPQKTVEIINEQAKAQMEGVVSQLLQAAFTADEETWLDQLGITEANDQHLEKFVAVTEVINNIFDNATYDMNRTNPVEVQNDQMEELAALLMQVQELRTALALSVSQLLQQAKKGFESPVKGKPKKVKK